MNAARLFLLLAVASVGACTSDPAASDAPTTTADMTPPDPSAATDTSAVAERVDSAGPVRPIPKNVPSTEYSAPATKTTTTGN
ncbi:hypothetical protein [Hymenobacter radiodurans]|uniref:hypothetical protein n=1 Tax=Hymenobacter radiodurans TaxID=2496028 RepID=UPI001058B6CC|nr:hypothetical protein [Hymenobacter radiodurans]